MWTGWTPQTPNSELVHSGHCNTNQVTPDLLPSFEVKRGKPPVTIPLARGLEGLFDACTMRAIKTAVEEIERAAHVLATISNTIDIDAVISSFNEERHAELDAQIQQTTAKHPRAVGMVDSLNTKKVAFTKDSIFNTFVTRITISFSDSDDTLRAKIGDTLPVQDAKRQGLHCKHTTHTRASRKQSAWHNRFPRVEDEICHRQHVSSSRARRWNHRKTLCGGAGTRATQYLYIWRSTVKYG